MRGQERFIIDLKGMKEEKALFKFELRNDYFEAMEAKDINGGTLQALVEVSKVGDAYLERGKLLLSMGDVDGAEEDADHLVSIAPKVEAVLLFKAKVLVARQEMAEAADVYSEAIEVNPFCIEAFKGRGTARMALGDKEGAESDMKQLLELDPDALKGISGEYKNE